MRGQQYTANCTCTNTRTHTRKELTFPQWFCSFMVSVKSALLRDSSFLRCTRCTVSFTVTAAFSNQVVMLHIRNHCRQEQSISLCGSRDTVCVMPPPKARREQYSCKHTPALDALITTNHRSEARFLALTSAFLASACTRLHSSPSCHRS